MKRIVITGGNRGIGREACSQLAELGHEVILTARDSSKGQQAAEDVGATFMLLDVASEDSIQAFIKEFNGKYDRLDVLVNNAGVFLDQELAAREMDLDRLHQTMQINTYGPWSLTNGLTDALLKSADPRVINVSSGLGAINEMAGGYPSYRLSKVSLNAITKMLAAEHDKVRVNSMCPGWVRTDMGGSGASRPVEKGAETIVWLATAEDIPNGKFLRDKQVIEW